jgi:hypothetical protein
MPIIRDVLYWPKHLRDAVKIVTQHFQQEELKNNQLVETSMRDVIILCIHKALPEIQKMPLEDFKRKVNQLKSRG